MFPRNETGTRVRSPKPPFYETALLSPSDSLLDLMGKKRSTLAIHPDVDRISEPASSQLQFGARHWVHA